MFNTDAVIVENFAVYNQPLFAYPDTADVTDALLYGMLRDEDIMVHAKRAMIANLNIGKIRVFAKNIETGRYPFGYAQVQTTFTSGATTELQEAAIAEFGEGTYVHHAAIGRMNEFSWVTSELYAGRGTLAPSSDGAHVGRFILAKEINVEEGYECSFDAYGLKIIYIPDDGGPSLLLDIVGATKTDTGHALIILDNTEAYDSWFNVAVDGLEEKHSTPVYVVHIFWCDDYLFRSDIWVYDPATNKYPALQIVDLSFGSPPDKEIEAFPAIPMRIRNVDYNDEASPLYPNRRDLERQMDVFGIDAKQFLDAIVKDPEADLDAIDNIFCNFGVRIWDESIAGRQYLYIFFQEVFGYLMATNSQPEDIYYECIQDPIADTGDMGGGVGEGDPIDPPVHPACASISLNTQWSNFSLIFATIINDYYPKDQILADPLLSRIFYSNQKYIDTDGNIKGTFYSSSGEFLLPAGFTAMTAKEVDRWVDPEQQGIKSHIPIPEGEPGWDYLKPAVKIKGYTGAIIDADGNRLPIGSELTPENVYKYENGLVKALPPPVHQEVREVVYYEITNNGINAYTVVGLSGKVVVQDTETDQNRLVKLWASNTNSLTIPLFFGLIENRYPQRDYRRSVDAVVSSLHVTIYVADIEVIELPWWMVWVQVVGFVISVIAFYAAPLVKVGVDIAVNVMIAMATAYIMSQVIFPILQGLVGEWGMVIISAAMIAYGGYKFFITEGLAGLTAMSLSEILSTVMNVITVVGDAVKLYMKDQQEDEFQLLQDSYKEDIDAMHDVMLSMEVFEPNDTAQNALYGSSHLVMNPLDPEIYFNKIDNYHEIGFDLLEIDNMYPS